MRDFRELEVWQKAHSLTLSVYQTTAAFPKVEVFGITSQIRRAAASIGANIAEGAGKLSNAELQRYLQVASGSASELTNHLILARDLGYMDHHRYVELDDELQRIRKMLSAFMSHLRGRAKSEQPTAKS